MLDKLSPADTQVVGVLVEAASVPGLTAFTGGASSANPTPASLQWQAEQAGPRPPALRQWVTLEGEPHPASGGDAMVTQTRAPAPGGS